MNLAAIRSVLRQFLGFAGVGAVGTAAHYSILLFLVEIVSVSPVPATTLGFVAGACINYTLSRRVVFRSKVPFTKGLLRFLAIAALGACLNASILAALLMFLPIHYLLAQLVATAMVLVFNFAANRCWTFREVLREPV
jgi:putative flippase GtrA